MESKSEDVVEAALGQLHKLIGQFAPLCNAETNWACTYTDSLTLFFLNAVRRKTFAVFFCVSIHDVFHII